MPRRIERERLANQPSAFLGALPKIVTHNPELGTVEYVSLIAR